MPRAGYEVGEYMKKNLHYPAEALKKGIEGKVLVQFTVGTDGSISDVQIRRGIGGGCDEEAKRIVENMPPWQPAVVDGKPVKAMYTQPITFALDHNTGSKGKADDGEVYQFVDQMPKPGFNLNEFLRENLHYPKSARNNNEQDRVAVTFTVNEDGSLSDVNVLRGEYPDLNEEAIRVVKNMPKWMPGKMNGKPVKVKYTQPITFRMEK